MSDLYAAMLINANILTVLKKCRNVRIDFDLKLVLQLADEIAELI